MPKSTKIWNHVKHWIYTLWSTFVFWTLAGQMSPIILFNTCIEWFTTYAGFLLVSNDKQRPKYPLNTVKCIHWYKYYKPYCTLQSVHCSTVYTYCIVYCIHIKFFVNCSLMCTLKWCYRSYIHKILSLINSSMIFIVLNICRMGCRRTY